MRKFITVMACAALVLAYSNTTTAQVSADANVSVTIQSTLSITNLTGVQNLGFGNVLPDATYTIEHEDGVDFRIDGASSVPVIVSFTPPSVLNGPGLDIPFTADFRGNSTSDATSASSLSTGSTVPMNADGNYYLWLGGQITPANILPGTYQGTFTVSVAY